MLAKLNKGEKYNMKKFIVIIICLFVLTGCSATAEMTIDENNKVSEKIYLFEDKKYFDESGMSLQDYVDFNLDFYGKKKFSNYDLSKYFEGNNLVALLSRKSDNLCLSIKYSGFSDFFETLDCKEEKNYFELKGKMVKSCVGECYEGFTYDNIKIVVNLPQKAIKNNADEASETKYIWNFDGQTDKDVYLKIKKITTKKSLNSFTNKALIIALGIGVLIIVLAVIVLHNRYEKNKLEY